MSNNIKIGDIYRHCKGREYQVVLVSKREADQAKLVSYQAVVNPDLIPWTRPLDEFLGLNDNGIRRFVLVTEEFRKSIEECQ